MERDALLAHGTSFLLQDRLMNCSDYSTAWVCRKCGSLISLGYEEQVGSLGDSSNGEYCRICRGEDDNVRGEGVTVNVPNTVKVQEGVGRGKEMDVIAVPCELGTGCLRVLRLREADNDSCIDSQTCSVT
jgi:DNA-directed RNA polymerase I subunit RPA2